MIELTDIEARVVGCLVEKDFTTPDIYPMTTNSIVTACNQKSNRDPVVSFDSITVDAALLDLRQRNIVRMVHTPGARSTKHRHTLDEMLELDRAETALLSVLLLRGPQTLGELRSRTERHQVLESLAEVEARMSALAQRTPAIVEQMDRQPGQKERRWRQLINDESDRNASTDSRDGSGALAAASGTTGSTSFAAPPMQTALSPAESVVGSRAHAVGASAEPAVSAATSDRDQRANHEDRIAKLEREVARLSSLVGRLRASLGETG